MSLGVLHHLPDPGSAFRTLVPFARPGGYVHVYVYWVPPTRWHRAVLRAVSASRRLTTRLPQRLLHLLCYPLAAGLFLSVVLPHRWARNRSWLGPLDEALPLKAYTDYPFGVLLNDQFDRLSAPIEHRFTEAEIRGWLDATELQEPHVLRNNGWVAGGRRRLQPDRAAT
jgi:hypothetical protein